MNIKKLLATLMLSATIPAGSALLQSVIVPKAFAMETKNDDEPNNKNMNKPLRDPLLNGYKNPKPVTKQHTRKSSNNDKIYYNLDDPSDTDDYHKNIVIDDNADENTDTLNNGLKFDSAKLFEYLKENPDKSLPVMQNNERSLYCFPPVNFLLCANYFNFVSNCTMLRNLGLGELIDLLQSNSQQLPVDSLIKAFVKKFDIIRKLDNNLRDTLVFVVRTGNLNNNQQVTLCALINMITIQ